MSSYQRRPTAKEIDRYLKRACSAIDGRRVAFANPAKVVGELMKLDIGDSDEVWELIRPLLDEIAISDYAGGHPPQKSYEPSVANCDLWAFVWVSERLKKRMYLKFAMKEETFYYVSLHESKEVI